MDKYENTDAIMVTAQAKKVIDNNKFHTRLRSAFGHLDEGLEEPLPQEQPDLRTKKENYEEEKVKHDNHDRMLHSIVGQAKGNPSTTARSPIHCGIPQNSKHRYVINIHTAS